MAPVVVLIDALKHVVDVVDVANLLKAVREESDLLAVLPVYLAALAWLVHRWTTRRRLRRRRLSCALRLGVGLLRFFSGIAFLAVALLLATARTAGRSTFRSGARF